MPAKAKLYVACGQEFSETSSKAQQVEETIGKRIIVLGGTAGIGLSVARLASEEGATAVVASSNQAKIDRAIRTSGATGRYLIESPLGHRRR